MDNKDMQISMLEAKVEHLEQILSFYERQLSNTDQNLKLSLGSKVSSSRDSNKLNIPLDDALANNMELITEPKIKSAFECPYPAYNAIVSTLESLVLGITRDKIPIIVINASTVKYTDSNSRTINENIANFGQRICMRLYDICLPVVKQLSKNYNEMLEQNELCADDVESMHTKDNNRVQNIVLLKTQEGQTKIMRRLLPILKV
tara:strand:- start:14130 stop:14741 length:612 start_codon:yes stop_codon:yes gene_type:complete